MISKKFRFHGHNSPKFVFAKGQSARSKWFAVRWTANLRRKHSRIGVIVSKKVFKSAVKRNRIRRRTYEVVRPFLTDLRIIDVIISVYSPEVYEAKIDDIREQLEPLLQQAFREDINSPKLNQSFTKHAAHFSHQPNDSRKLH